MPLKEYELFHGTVLTKLVRRDNPVTLRLIETNTSEAWSVYRINDINIFIKYSSNLRTLKKGGKSWTFPFSPHQIEQIFENMHISLVCGSHDIKSKEMEICFIENKHAICLLSGDAKSITVHLEPGQRFRVSSSAVKQKIIIPRNAIEKYEVPL